MLIDQLTTHLLKDNEEVNVHVKRLRPMLDATTVVDPALDRDDKGWVTLLNKRFAFQKFQSKWCWSSKFRSSEVLGYLYRILGLAAGFSDIIRA
jgi:hypothetical protein